MSGRMHVRILIGCQFPQQFHNVEIKIASHSNIWLAHCLQIIWLQFVCKKKSDIWQNLNITTSFVVQKRVASESLVSNLLNFRLRPRIFWLNFPKFWVYDHEPWDYVIMVTASAVPGLAATPQSRKDRQRDTFGLNFRNDLRFRSRLTRTGRETTIHKNSIQNIKVLYLCSALSSTKIFHWKNEEY